MCFIIFLVAGSLTEETLQFAADDDLNETGHASIKMTDII